MSFQQEIDQAIKSKKLYFVGKCLPVDWYSGFQEWLALAESGNTMAQFNVGRCYARGDGTDKDLILAEKWYLAAATTNDARVWYNLFLLYENKENKFFDADKSSVYFNKAVAAGDSRAIEAVAKAKIAADLEKIKVEKDTNATKQKQHDNEMRPIAEAISNAVFKCDEKTIADLLQKAKLMDADWTNAFQNYRKLEIKFVKGKVNHDDQYSEYMQEGNTRFSRNRTTTSHYSLVIFNPSSEPINIQRYIPRGLPRYEIPSGGRITEDMGRHDPKLRPDSAVINMIYTKKYDRHNGTLSIKHPIPKLSSVWLVSTLIVVICFTAILYSLLK